MIENVLRNIGGVEVFGIVSVCLFFAFFAGMLLWVWRLKHPYLNSMRGLPLDGPPAPRPEPADRPNPDPCHE